MTFIPVIPKRKVRASGFNDYLAIDIIDQFGKIIGLEFYVCDSAPFLTDVNISKLGIDYPETGFIEVVGKFIDGHIEIYVLGKKIILTDEQLCDPDVCRFC